MKPRRHKFGLMLMIALTGLLICAVLPAQSPEKMSYQAVVRDAGGVLLSNQNVGIRIQILQTTEFGAAVYVETHTRTTNSNGLVTLEIGGGSVVMGTFSGINWNNGPYFLKTEIDPGGGTSYSIIGTTQLMSVPYALQAKSVTTETDPVFSASPAAGITGSNITNWNTAFGWGKHAGLYRPVSWVPSWADVTGKPATFTPSAHSHSAVDITSGTLAVTRGGSGFSSYTVGNYIRASGATTLEQRTPAQVLADIGAAPTSHNHSAADITAGALPVARGGTGTTTFTSGNVLIGSGTGAITTMSRSGIDSRATFPPAAHTHGNITNTGTIGSTAGRIVTTGTGGNLQATAGTMAGQMLYWNGTAWVNVAPGATGQVLTLINGVPTWEKPAIPTVGSTDVYNHSTGKVWMDRNLGAMRVAVSSTDAWAYGNYYQWGRGTDGHQLSSSSTTTTLSSTNTPGHGNFILANSSPYDWRNPQNANLWQGVSGVNNPCPGGYRLPTDAEWNAERLSWSSNNAAGAFASPLKLPVAGFRNRSNGSISSVGTDGYYWSSTVSSTNSRYLYFNSGLADVFSSYRANGTSVRCLKD